MTLKLFEFNGVKVEIKLLGAGKLLTLLVYDEQIATFTACFTEVLDDSSMPLKGCFLGKPTFLMRGPGELYFVFGSLEEVLSTGLNSDGSLGVRVPSALKSMPPTIGFCQPRTGQIYPRILGSFRSKNCVQM